MKIARNISELALARKSVAADLALVPTMGALHAGHLSLVELAQSKAAATAVSIFVNPSQFNNADDLKKYPRTIENDLELLKVAGVDIVFIPDVAELYPDGFQTSIALSELSQPLEGKFRPGHFKGVATVVTILLNLVQPSKVVFGEKDFQQLCVVKQLIKDLKIPVEVIPAPTFREESGLAMSSRNELLSKADREIASNISKVLISARSQVEAGETDCEKIINKCHELFNQEKAIDVEYLIIASSINLIQQKEITKNSRVFFAGAIAGVRLIDNIKLALA